MADFGRSNLSGGAHTTLASTLADAYNSGLGPTSGEESKYKTYLKLFSGELFKAYQNNTIARSLSTTRTLKNGKSMQFLFTGGLESYYHVPGTPLLGMDASSGGSANQLGVNEKTIRVDDLLVASTFVYDLDETLSHYDLRGEIARKLGYSLANKYDQKVFIAACRAAQEAQVIAADGQFAGARIEIGNAAKRGTTTHAAKMVEAFFRAATRFDECNVPADGRVAILPPESYYNLIEEVDNGVINRDVQGDALQSGKGLYSIAGIKILKSNNLPTSNTAVSYVAGENNDYSYGANQNLQGLIMHRDSVGVVEAIGPQVQTTGGDINVMYQGDLIVSRLAMGASSLNPAGAITIHAGGATSGDTDELSATTVGTETAGVIYDIAAE